MSKKKDLVYKLDVMGTVSYAWELVYGAKLSFLGALTWASIICVALAAAEIFIIKKMFPGAPPPHHHGSYLANVSLHLLAYGLNYMGINRALNRPIDASMVFYPVTHFSMLLKLIVYWFFIMIITLLPLLLIIALMSQLSSHESLQAVIAMSSLFILAAVGMIYLTIRTSLGWGFILDKEYGPIDALKLSFKVTRCNVFKIFSLYFVNAFILLLGAIPLGLGLIWAIPYVYINYGVVYKELSENNLQ